MERRKFTAEEGVSCRLQSWPFYWQFDAGSPHFVKWWVNTPRCVPRRSCSAAYNAFARYGQSSNWCKSHALSFRAMSRVVSIRSQLRKYMQRFNIGVESCEGDGNRLRRCLVTGYWRNIAKWVADGTYRSLQGNKVQRSIIDVLPKLNWTDFPCTSNICPV